jgi:peptide/nickel transport system substrate-binding protein
MNVGVPANGPVSPASWAYDHTIPAITRDLAKAKAKLAEGGRPGGFPFTITTANIPINIQEAEVFGPGAALFVTVVGLNFVGDAVRDALDPRVRA